NPDERRNFLFDWPADDFWSANLLDSRRLGNANWSPHFPTVGHNVAELYTIQSGGEKVDGVIAVTPEFLARVIKVTGPVVIDGVLEPLTGDSLVPFLTHDAYHVFEDDRDKRRQVNSALT